MNNYTFLGHGNIKMAMSSIMIITKSHPYPPPNFTKTFLLKIIIYKILIINPNSKSCGLFTIIIDL
jgi:hypothetical protein